VIDDPGMRCFVLDAVVEHMTVPESSIDEIIAFAHRASTSREKIYTLPRIISRHPVAPVWYDLMDPGYKNLLQACSIQYLFLPAKKALEEPTDRFDEVWAEFEKVQVELLGESVSAMEFASRRLDLSDMAKTKPPLDVCMAASALIKLFGFDPDEFVNPLEWMF